MMAIKRCGFIKLLLSAMFLLVICWGLTGCTNNYDENLAYGYSDAYYLLCEEVTDHLEYSQKNYEYYVYRDIALHDEEEANYFECTQKNYDCYMYEDIALYDDDEIDYLDGNLTTYYDYQENEIPTTNNLDDETNAIMHIRQTVDIVGHWHYVGSRNLHTGEFSRIDFFEAMQRQFVFKSDGVAINFCYVTSYGIFEESGHHRFRFRVMYSRGEDGWQRRDWVVSLAYDIDTGLLRENSLGLVHYYERYTVPEIHVQIATAEVLNQFDSYYEFVELDEPDALVHPRIMLTTNTELFNFRYVSRLGICQFWATREIEWPPLTTVEQITPYRPFVFTWMGEDVMQYREISFLDTSEHGHSFVVHFCTISETVYLERVWFVVFPSSPLFPFEL